MYHLTNKAKMNNSRYKHIKRWVIETPSIWQTEDTGVDAWIRLQAFFHSSICHRVFYFLQSELKWCYLGFCFSLPGTNIYAIILSEAHDEHPQTMKLAGEFSLAKIQNCYSIAWIELKADWEIFKSLKKTIWRFYIGIHVFTFFSVFVINLRIELKSTVL